MLYLSENVYSHYLNIENQDIYVGFVLIYFYPLLSLFYDLAQFQPSTPLKDDKESLKESESEGIDDGAHVSQPQIRLVESLKSTG